MPGLVESQDPLLLVGDDAPLLKSGDDPLHRRVEVAVPDVLRARAPGEDGGLVAEVCEIGARKPRRLLRDQAQIHVGRERLAARVDPQDRLPAGNVRRRHEDLPVEASRAK